MTTPPPPRRRFLSFCTDCLMALLGLCLAIPALGYFLSPLWGRRQGAGSESGFADAGRVADLPVGEWRLLSLEVEQQDGWKKSHVKHAVWVRRQGKGDRDLSVLSSICPHLGCPINAHPGPRQFVCPCHGGVFDANGKNVSGPPPRAMDPLDFEVRNGRLWIRWQDFKIGVAERIAVHA
jgi:nitrite reductase/ring-hydroxylating ferredoxin subunit